MNGLRPNTNRVNEKSLMLMIDDKDLTPMQAHETNRRARRFRPLHKRLRIFFSDGDKRTPAWQWRGALFRHNKRRKPLNFS